MKVLTPSYTSYFGVFTQVPPGLSNKQPFLDVYCFEEFNISQTGVIKHGHGKCTYKLEYHGKTHGNICKKTHLNMLFLDCKKDRTK